MTEIETEEAQNIINRICELLNNCNEEIETLQQKNEILESSLRKLEELYFQVCKEKQDILEHYTKTTPRG